MGFSTLSLLHNTTIHRFVETEPFLVVSRGAKARSIEAWSALPTTLRWDHLCPSRNNQEFVLAAFAGRDQVGQQIHSVGRSQAGNGVPAGNSVKANHLAAVIVTRDDIVKILQVTR
jgi:hypothetical protein